MDGLFAYDERTKKSMITNYISPKDNNETTMRTTLIPMLTMLILSSPLFAAEPKAFLNIPYTETKNEKQTLDLFAPPDAKNLPIIFWIHGGGWQAGNKEDVQI
jgi:acetyl esterase/lipase